MQEHTGVSRGTCTWKVTTATQKQGFVQGRAGNRACVPSHSVRHFDDGVRLELLQILWRTDSRDTDSGRSTIWQ